MNDEPTLFEAPKLSQREVVLAALRKGPICAEDVEYIYRLAARINDLRRDGWVIDTKIPCGRHNHVGALAEYRLIGEPT